MVTFVSDRNFIFEYKYFYDQYVKNIRGKHLYEKAIEIVLLHFLFCLCTDLNHQRH